MNPLPQEDIIKFLKTNIQPLSNSIYGSGYRASVVLTDNLYLPCVMFRNPTAIIDLAIRRFKEEQSGKSVFSKSSGLGYREIIKTFVANGNCINYYDIAKVDKSDFAFPESTLRQIRGETKMAWTGFVAVMKDGKKFAFGTSFLFEFFDMPQGYTPNDIIEIINHSYLDKENNLKSYNSSDIYDEFDKTLVYRERPYFECYIDNL
jgi:hypothetical protein